MQLILPGAPCDYYRACGVPRLKSGEPFSSHPKQAVPVESACIATTYEMMPTSKVMLTMPSTLLLSSWCSRLSDIASLLAPSICMGFQALSKVNVEQPCCEGRLGTRQPACRVSSFAALILLLGIMLGNRCNCPLSFCVDEYSAPVIRHERLLYMAGLS